uniref:RING-CH-type domain-containing protein n=1 Tax=Zooxanthella nutricula TaxID=1333877 RepID=A0A7S2N1M8_9DINO
MSTEASSSSATGAAVSVTARTWVRDSHDLFDFESGQVHERTFRVEGSALCVRSGLSVEARGEEAGAQGGAAVPLVRVVEKDGRFWIDRVASSKRLWSVVRDAAPEGFRLREGDFVKLGRFKFRVRQLVGSGKNAEQPDLSLGGSKATCQVEDQGALEAKCCRICLMEGPGDDDPLIRPCSCKGFIEYVHLKCLRYWMKSRLNVAGGPGGSFFYRSLSCELCTQELPARVGIDGRTSLLMEVPETKAPYVVLETMVRDARRHSKGLHVVSLAEKPCVLGRGHEIEVRIADVSISRSHATISYEDGNFVLRDDKSKFGTLVALHRSQEIFACRPHTLQMGRTVLSLALAPAGAGAADAGDRSTAAPSPSSNARTASAGEEDASRATVQMPSLSEERLRDLRLLVLMRQGSSREATVLRTPSAPASTAPPQPSRVSRSGFWWPWAVGLPAEEQQQDGGEPLSPRVRRIVSF